MFFFSQQRPLPQKKIISGEIIRNDHGTSTIKFTYPIKENRINLTLFEKGLQSLVASFCYKNVFFFKQDMK